MGRGSSKAGKGGGTVNATAQTREEMIENLAQAWSNGMKYGDLEDAVEEYTSKNGGDEDEIINEVTRKAGEIINSKDIIKGSISGKPFNANDYKTWDVGTEVMMKMQGDVYETDKGVSRGKDTGYIYPGKVVEVHKDHLIVDVPSYSDHLWVDDNFADLFKAKSGGKKKRSK